VASSATLALTTECGVVVLSCGPRNGPPRSQVAAAPLWRDRVADLDRRF
jgi:hypothetical protein